MRVESAHFGAERRRVDGLRHSGGGRREPSPERRLQSRGGGLDGGAVQAGTGGRLGCSPLLRREGADGRATMKPPRRFETTMASETEPARRQTRSAGSADEAAVRRRLRWPVESGITQR